jgi:hypothetical protein
MGKLSQLIVCGVDCHWGGSLRGLSGLYQKKKKQNKIQPKNGYVQYASTLSPNGIDSSLLRRTQYFDSQNLTFHLVSTFCNVTILTFGNN